MRRLNHLTPTCRLDGGRSAKLRVVAVAVGLFALAGRTAVPNGLRPYSVDDYLKLEDTGAAAIDPTGRWIVWEQAPPYDQLQDYGLGITGTWQGASFRLMGVNLISGASGPLFPPVPATAYRVGEFSPSGRYLIFVSARAGRVRLGIFDFATSRVRELDPPPLLRSGMSQPEAVWISKDRLVFAAFPNGEGPIALVFRRGAGDRLAAARRRSWQGKVASVDVAASHGDDTPQPLRGTLFEFNVTTHVMRKLAEGQFEGLTVSRSGGYLAALRQWRRKQPTPGVPDLDWVYSRSRLMVFDLTGRAPAKVVADGEDVMPNTLEWASDSDRLAFFAWKEGEGVRSGMFLALDATNGAVIPIPHAGLDLASERERGGPQRPERAVWLDGKLAVYARRNPIGDESPGFTYRDRDVFEGTQKTAGSGSHGPQWFLLGPSATATNLTEGLDDISGIPLYADGKSLVVLAGTRIWRLTSGGAPMQLATANSAVMALPPEVVMSESHPRFQSNIALMANLADHSALVLVDLNSGRKTWFPMKAGSVPLAVSPTAGALLLRNGIGKGSEIALQTAIEYRVLHRLNPHLDDVADLEWISFRYRRNESTEDLEGCLLLPADYRAGRKYPVIVEVYPNRAAPCSDPSYRSRLALGAHPGAYSEQLLAARGFIVFRPDTHGALPPEAGGPLAGITELVDRGIDALLVAGYGDATRLGLMGVSQGGFASLWLATQSKRYAAVVSLNGWSDMYSESMEAHLNSELYPDQMPFMGDLARYEATAGSGSDFGMGASPWEAPDRYVRNSPLFNAPFVSSPVLLIHSDMDGWGPQYDMMFTALYAHRKEAELRIYRGEGHGPSSPANIRDMWNRIFYWFDHYLCIQRDAHGDMVFADGEVLRQPTATSLQTPPSDRPFSCPHFGGNAG